MSQVVEKEISTAEVTIAGVTVSPATVTLVHEGRDSRNVRRSFVQQVPVRDANLAARAASELHSGDQVQVTVVNEWREDGCDTYLTDFTKKMEGNQEASDTPNGFNGFSYTEVRQVVTQPKQSVKV